jgi:predicted nucleotidyltransferase
MRDLIQPPWAVTSEKIREAVQRIVEASQPRKVIVFGSQARGGGGTDSDLDLMVVLGEVRDPASESVRLRRLLKGLLMSVDLVVVDQAKFDYWRDTPGNVFYEAARDGKCIYEGSRTGAVVPQ